MSKSPTLQDFVPPEGYMITRRATKRERIAIGKTALIDRVSISIWNALVELNGTAVRVSLLFGTDTVCFFRSMQMSEEVRITNRSRDPVYLNFVGFKRWLANYESCEILRINKACQKALRDRKSIHGMRKKQQAQIQNYRYMAASDFEKFLDVYIDATKKNGMIPPVIYMSKNTTNVPKGKDELDYLAWI